MNLRNTLLFSSIFLATVIHAVPVSKKDTIIRMPLLIAQLAKVKPTVRIEIKRINFNPKQKTGFHLHPIPVVGYIAKGSIYFQIEGEKPITLKEGDAFYEPANVKILHFDNISKIADASFIAFYLLGSTDHELIKML